jgi:hypothetical protein
MSFTGVGSHYIFTKSPYIIGQRATFYNNSYIIGINYINELINGQMPIAANQHILFIGDSTDRELIRTFCTILKDNNWKLNLNKPHNNHFLSCQHTKNNISIENTFTFGAYSPTNLNLAYKVLPDTNSYNAQNLISKLSVTTPTHVIMSSCLWDANNQSSLKYGEYSSKFIRSYEFGMQTQIHTVHTKFKYAELWLQTCKPINQLDREHESLTRTRRIQVAMDNVLKYLKQKNNDYVHGIIDANSVLLGFEYFTKTDKRHYTGKPALTLINAIFNDIYHK